MIRNKQGKSGNAGPIEIVFAIVIGLILVLSIPIIKDFFIGLIGMILGIILLAILIGLIIFAVWKLIEYLSEEYGGFNGRI